MTDRQANRRVSGHVRLVQRKTGARWYGKWRGPDGVQVQKMLGDAWEDKGRPPAGYLTERMAKERLQEILADARRGTLEGTRGRSGRTVADATAEWLRHGEIERELADSTYGDYRSVAKVLERELGASTPLEDIDTERVNRLRSELLTGVHYSRRSVQKHLIALHGVLKRAYELGWIAANPSERAGKVAIKSSGDFNVLEPAEVMAVARAAATELDAAIITVAAFTGLRLGELRALRWRDVDFTGATVHVRRNRPVGYREKTPKSDKTRSLPLLDQAARPLDALSRRELFAGQNDLVFTVSGAALDDGSIRDGFYAALEAVGIERWRRGVEDDPIIFHDLRHTFGTTMARLGADVVSIQAWMGHADIATTQRYMHYAPKTGVAAELSRKVAAELGELDTVGELERERGGLS
jgi:integrase